MKLKTLLFENKNKFKLFDHFDDTEIQVFTKRYFHKMNINIKVLSDLLQYKFKKSNIYDILILADFLQYKEIDNLILEIQIAILDKNIELSSSYPSLLIMDKFFEHEYDENNILCGFNECISNGICSCSLEHTTTVEISTNINHICCYEYLTRYKNKEYITPNKNITLIDRLCVHDWNLDFIKYLLNKNLPLTIMGYLHACQKDYLEMFEYLLSLNQPIKYNGEIITTYENKPVMTFLFDNAIQCLSYKIVKYLFSNKYTCDDENLDWAVYNSYIEMIKILLDNNMSYSIDTLHYINSEVKELLSKYPNLLFIGENYHDKICNCNYDESITKCMYEDDGLELHIKELFKK